MIFHGERLFFSKFLEEKNIIAERHERNKFSSRTRSIVFTRQGWNFFQRKKEETLEKGSFARSDIELAGTVFSPPRSWNIFERGAPFRGTQRNSRRLSRVGKQRERQRERECDRKVEIAIWISIKRKFHLPEVSDRASRICTWENAR